MRCLLFTSLTLSLSHFTSLTNLPLFFLLQPQGPLCCCSNIEANTHYTALYVSSDLNILPPDIHIANSSHLSQMYLFQWDIQWSRWKEWATTTSPPLLLIHNKSLSYCFSFLPIVFTIYPLLAFSTFHFLLSTPVLIIEYKLNERKILSFFVIDFFQTHKIKLDSEKVLNKC